MITYINSENASKYSLLWREAEQALAAKWIGENKNPEAPEYFGPKITDPDDPSKSYYTNGISSLNTYFSWIQDLLTITHLPVLGADGQMTGEIYDFDGMRFSMLPLDEEVFEIDANTRKISVPKAFADNGISVQGDEISEVVYFKINRFYDATDLFNQNIMIEWIAPSGLKGYSVPTVKVLDESTNYVIFGWALASSITEKNGDVTFSVRFYKYDDDNNKIQYSLSTLTQKAKINPSIGLDIPGLLGSEGHLEGYKVLGDEIKALIKERSENSNFGQAGDKAVVPELYVLEVEPENSNVPYIVVLEKDGGVWSATVSGSGFSSDAGVISYFWKKFNYETGDRMQTEGDNKLKYEEVYTKLTREQAAEVHAACPAMKFWVPNIVDGKLMSHQEITMEQILADETILEVFRQDTKCTFDGVGYYKMVIKNRKGRATETFETDPIIVYPPNVPADVTITETAFLDDEAKKDVTVECKIPATPDRDPAYARVDPVKVGFRAPAAEGAGGKGPVVEQYAFDPANETVAYEWHFIARGAADSTATVVDGATEKTMTPAEEGDYFCRLTGWLNNAPSATTDSAKCRVTYKPARPIFTIAGTSQINGNDIAVKNDPTLEMPEANSGLEAGDFAIYAGRDMEMFLSYNLASMQGKADHQLTDEITLQWYCYELKRDPATGHTTGTADLEDAVMAKQGVYNPSLKDTVNWPADTAIGEPIVLTVAELDAKIKDADVSIASIKPERDGYYFCIITNKYNGMEDVISTPLAYYDNQND